MESVFSVAFLKFLEYMGVTPGGLLVAVIVLVFLFVAHKSHNKRLERQDVKIDKLYSLVREVEKGQADQNRRMEDHGSHFDVIRQDLDRTLDISKDSNGLAIKAVGLVIDKIK